MWSKGLIGFQPFKQGKLPSFAVDWRLFAKEDNRWEWPTWLFESHGWVNLPFQGERK